MAGLPGVTDVSFSGAAPLTMSTAGGNIQIDDLEVSRSDGSSEVPIQLMNVDVDYFSVVRLPMRRGRSFAQADDAQAPRVAVVNETFAKRFWPDGSAIGRTFGYRGDRVTIVGIARDAKYGSLSEEMPAFAYFPHGSALATGAGPPRPHGRRARAARPSHSASSSRSTRRCLGPR